MQKDDAIIQAKHDAIREITKQANFDFGKLEQDNAEFIRAVEKAHGLKFNYSRPGKKKSPVS